MRFSWDSSVDSRTVLVYVKDADALPVRNAKVTVPGLLPQTVDSQGRVWIELQPNIQLPIAAARDGRVFLSKGNLIQGTASPEQPFFGLLLSPIIAAAAMSFSSVSVVGNALRLRRVEV